MDSRQGIDRAAVIRVGLFSVVFLSLAASGLALADQIRLKDGKEFPARVLGKDSDSVVVRIPRADVAAVNGQPLAAPVAEGSPAPAFEVVDLSGATHSLAESRGHVTLLQFWATWCPHCRHDLPLLKDLFSRYQNQGIRFIAVSTDQDLNKLQSFVRDQQLPYPIIPVLGQSPSSASSLPDLYEIQGIPAYYLIDADGIITKKFAGSAVEGQVDLEGILKRMLASAERPTAASASGKQNASPKKKR